LIFVPGQKYNSSINLLHAEAQIFLTSSVEEAVFSPVYNFGFCAKDQMVEVCGFLFDSIDFHVCFCAIIMLFLLLWLGSVTLSMFCIANFALD
jgi:hypothetical protein